MLLLPFVLTLLLSSGFVLDLILEEIEDLSCILRMNAHTEKSE